MAYTIKARYYASNDQFGETFVLTSDNRDVDVRTEVGRKVRIVPLCRCGLDVTDIGPGATGGCCHECFMEVSNF